MRKNVFSDPKKLQELLTLRKIGLSLHTLGDRFGIDHSTIVYHLKKHEAGLPEKIIWKPRKEVIHRPKVMTDETGEVINPGKSYKEYLRVDQERRRKEVIKYLKTS